MTCNKSKTSIIPNLSSSFSMPTNGQRKGELSAVVAYAFVVVIITIYPLVSDIYA